VFRLSAVDRTARKVNTPGESYFFVLTVSDDTRQSAPVVITVNINPQVGYCVSLKIQELIDQRLILRSDLEFAFIKVDVKQNCTDVLFRELRWEAPDISYQFWTYENESFIKMS